MLLVWSSQKAQEKRGGGGMKDFGDYFFKGILAGGCIAAGLLLLFGASLIIKGVEWYLTGDVPYVCAYEEVSGSWEEMHPCCPRQYKEDTIAEGEYRVKRCFLKEAIE